MSTIKNSSFGDRQRRKRPQKNISRPIFGQKPSYQDSRRQKERPERKFKNTNKVREMGKRRPQNLRVPKLPTTPPAKLLSGSTATRNSGENSHKHRSTRRHSHPYAKLLFPLATYTLRLLIIGVGLGAIAGTVLSKFNPNGYPLTPAQDGENPAQIQGGDGDKTTNFQLPLTQEITPLRSKIQALVAASPDLQPGIFVIDLDTGAYLDWQGSLPFPAASTIKVPILFAFFQDVDAGKVRLDEMLVMDETVKASGSGGMQYQGLDQEYSALETATQMIVTSDNSATNMIIKRLGGVEALNQRFRAWGLQESALNNALPDIEGTNSASAKELVKLMAMVNQGELLSVRSRDRLLDIMQQTRNKTLIPQGLGKDASVANKTGNIGSVLADVALVDLPTGKRYLIAVMVKRPRNDTRAKTLIREISRVTYQYFIQPPVITNPVE